MSLMRSVKKTIRRNQAAYALLYPLYKHCRIMFMQYAQKQYGINPKKVVFSSFEGRFYSDNPRCISEKLHELCPDFEIVWLFQADCIDKVQVPGYVRKQLRNTRAGLIDQTTAKFWVDNFRHTESLWLDKNRQFYIQTWHGDRGFKRVGNAYIGDTIYNALGQNKQKRGL